MHEETLSIIFANEISPEAVESHDVLKSAVWLQILELHKDVATIKP
jgi:hypothetical protein